MVDSIINAAPVIRSLPIDTQVLGKAPVDSKQAMSTGSVGPRLDAQVLQAGAAMTQSGYTVQQLDDMALAAFTETENFLVDLARKEEAKQGLGDTAKSSLTFDPAAWDKHMSVLVSAIVALNVARQSSAAMSGVFTQIAFKAAEAQGVAIKAGGEAAMRAALGGAVVAGAMAVGGRACQSVGKQSNTLISRATRLNLPVVISRLRNFGWICKKHRLRSRSSRRRHRLFGHRANWTRSSITIPAANLMLPSARRWRPMFATR
ncbi:hypothetical protein [Pseudomonas sp. 65/3-MNA-CIBAN-0223]|uniref:hypothetical protein n=1 Tax=Pseudomonas sp. 65/3-MNA-CIBAN-0223 TaxID=3140476 RepID=UPI00332D124F